MVQLFCMEVLPNSGPRLRMIFRRKRVLVIKVLQWMESSGILRYLFQEWYFRNALVRANYTDLRNGIYETTEYLELFLRNLLLDEKMSFIIGSCT